jgi:hypothetical protein
MKLTVECIKEEALEIYRKSVCDNRIDEDFCAEIYETFTRRMKRYCEKYPDKKEVTPAFVANAVRYITRDIAKKRRKQEHREENVRILEQGICGEQEYTESEKDFNPREEKLYSLLRSVIACKPSYRMYAYFFVLDYSFYFSGDFIERVAMLTGVSPDTIREKVLFIRSKAIEFSTLRIEKAKLDASRVYNRIISCHRRMSEAFDEHERALLVEKCRELKTLQEKVLAARRKIKILPTIRDLAEIIGYNQDTVRYGLKVFHNILNNDPLTRVFALAA